LELWPEEHSGDHIMDSVLEGLDLVALEDFIVVVRVVSMADMEASTMADMAVLAAQEAISNGIDARRSIMLRQ